MRAPDAEAHKAEFDAWVADPENAAAYARAEENWLLVGGVAPEYLEAHRKASRTPARASARWALAAAVILALSLGVAWIALGNRGADPIIADNSIGDLLLDDGTRVALMDGAQIEQRFTPKERRVILSGGRARFTVAHDAARPFRVAAAGSETTALGTIFEIDLRAGQPVIHLIQGSVEVRATRNVGAAPIRLRPGQRATVANGGPEIVGLERDAPSTETVSPVPVAEPDSLLIADKLPLGTVIDRANRVNSLKIELGDTALAARPISGKFDVADARSLARKLAIALDLDVEEFGASVVLKAKIKN
ncbi:MAG: FecR domain-containing protein [Sphingopyxis sp.]|nr:FecR domain-containing protein [Sphingopyxis sp.]